VKAFVSVKHHVVAHGGKPDQEIENSKKQNNAYILVTRLPRTHQNNTNWHATTSLSTNGLTCLIITFTPSTTPSKIFTRQQKPTKHYLPKT